VGLLSAVAASVVLVAVSAQVFIGLNKVQSGAEVDSAYNQMLQLVGLNLSSPGACSLFFNGQVFTYSTVPSGWSRASGPDLVFGVLAPPASTPQTFGPWEVTKVDLEVDGCLVAQTPGVGVISCLDASGIPLDQDTSITGKILFKVQAWHPTRQAWLNRLEKVPFLVRAGHPVADATGVNFSYALGSASCGSSGSPAPSTPVDVDELMCKHLCVHPDTGQAVTMAGNPNPCWDATQRVCDLSHQTCQALGIARTGFNQCDLDGPEGFRAKVMTFGSNEQPNLKPCPHGTAASGLRLYPPRPNQTQMLCKSLPQFSTPGQILCRSCAVKAVPSLGGGAAAQQCSNHCATFGLSGWLHTNAAGGVSPGLAECSCGSPKDGVELCANVAGECSL
jgi:hypothetical protein